MLIHLTRRDCPWEAPMNMRLKEARQTPVSSVEIYFYPAFWNPFLTSWGTPKFVKKGHNQRIFISYPIKTMSAV